MLFLFLVRSATSFAQQITYSWSDALHGSAFEERYWKRSEVIFSEECRQRIKEKRVEKLEFYDQKGNQFHFVEFDTAGAINGEGYYGSLYFSVKRKSRSGNKELKTTSHYLGPFLVRTDSECVILHTYTNGDTSLTYKEYRTTIYKRGGLINEQNDFYNWNYFNHSQKFRTDYDTVFLYTCAQVDTAGNFEGSLQKGFINLDPASLKQHFFYKRFLETNAKNYYVEGESFIEPDTRSFVFCGTTMNDIRQNKEELNKNGLPDRNYYFSFGEKIVAYNIQYTYYK